MSATAPPRLTPAQRIQAAELARAIVAKVDPGQAMAVEEDLFDYVRDPDLVLRPPRTGDRPGGFGLGDLDTALVTYALPVAAAAIQYLASAAAEAVQLDVRPRLVARLRRLLQRTPSEPSPVQLSTAQLEDVMKKVYDNALALTKDKGDAEVLTNAVKGCLEASRNSDLS